MSESWFGMTATNYFLPITLLFYSLCGSKKYQKTKREIANVRGHTEP